MITAIEKKPTDLTPAERFDKDFEDVKKYAENPYEPKFGFKIADVLFSVAARENKDRYGSTKEIGHVSLSTFKDPKRGESIVIDSTKKIIIQLRPDGIVTPHFTIQEDVFDVIDGDVVSLRHSYPVRDELDELSASNLSSDQALDLALSAVEGVVKSYEELLLI